MNEKKSEEVKIIQEEITKQLEAWILIDDEESETDDGETIELIINKRERPQKTIQNTEIYEETKEQIVKKIAANGYSEDFLKLAINSKFLISLFEIIWMK